MFVDLCAHVPSDLTIHDASEIEESIRSALVEARSEIKEVHIKFVTVASNGKASER
jgi:divalent metal cation (Fe/Co/Zn/Cd) transporter